MLIDLSHLGLLQISGEGAMKLLQGQLTCNLTEISPTQTRLGAHCNPQGRIISFFRLFLFQDSYYLQMPNEILPEAMAALQKYAAFFKVKLTDASHTLQQIRCTSEALKLYQTELPQKTDDATVTSDCLIIKLSGTADYEIMGEPYTLKKITDSLTPSLSSNITNWKLTQITAGIPTIYPSTLGKLLPHDINLPEINAVSFNKGCYTGQEIIARMHYRNQRKKRMYRARVKTHLIPIPGSDIYHATPCGMIVDSCAENETCSQLLIIANQVDAESKQLFLDPDKIQPLELLTLPY